MMCGRSAVPDTGRAFPAGKLPLLATQPIGGGKHHMKDIPGSLRNGAPGRQARPGGETRIEAQTQAPGKVTRGRPRASARQARSRTSTVPSEHRGARIRHGKTKVPGDGHVITGGAPSNGRRHRVRQGLTVFGGIAFRDPCAKDRQAYRTWR